MFLRPFAGLLSWSIILGWLMERWRRRHGRAIHEWVEAIGEIESALRAGRIRLRESGQRLPRDRRGRVGPGDGRPRTPLAAREEVRSQRPAVGRRSGAAAHPERFEHVGQEHVLARRGNCHGLGPGRVDRADSSPPVLAGGRLRIDPKRRFHPQWLFRASTWRFCRSSG